MVPNQDREILRRLAGQIVTLTHNPKQREKIDGWKMINSLQDHRPMLWITEIPWGEFEGKVKELTPVCKDDECRVIEQDFRRILFKARHLPCDEVVDSAYWVRKKINGTGYGVEIRERTIQQDQSYVQSHAYEQIIKDFDDLDRIKMPSISYDEQTTMQKVRFVENLFGDILPVRIQGIRSHWFSPWDTIVCWTGVTQALMDLAARPDFVHAMLRRMTDSFLAYMSQLEEQDLLDNPHPLARVGSGGAGYTDELPRNKDASGRLKTADQWGGATAQIFSQVSPEMHEEFALNYEIEVMDRCGLNYYGCCEPLHDKMRILAKVPHLRKISISAWCDTAEAAAEASRKYVFSHKPSPAVFAFEKIDMAQAEDDLRRRLHSSRGMACEVIMKDISTVRGDVKRLIAWTEMAYRVANDSA